MWQSAIETDIQYTPYTLDRKPTGIRLLSTAHPCFSACLWHQTWHSRKTKNKGRLVYWQLERTQPSIFSGCTCIYYYLLHICANFDVKKKNLSWTNHDIHKACDFGTSVAWHFHVITVQRQEPRREGLENKRKTLGVPGKLWNVSPRFVSL